MNTRFLMPLLALTLVAVSAAPSSAADSKKPTYTVHWVLGHRNLDFFNEAAQNFKAVVEARTHGDIAVVIENAKDTGTDASPEAAAIPGRVSKGEIEMGHSFVDVMGTMDSRLYAFEAPYLMRDYRHMEGVLDGSVGQDLLSGLRAQHLVGLSFTYSGGGNGVASVSRPIRKPEDLKGLKVGVFGDEVNASWLKAVGAVPVPIKHELDSIAPMVRSGALDAVVITWRNFAHTGLQSSFKYFSLPESTYLVSVTYANDKFFDGLPKEYQQLLLEESRKAGRIERAKTIQLNEESREAMLSKGVKPAALTEAGRAAFAAALKPAYDGEIGRALGAPLIERIRKAADGTIAPVVRSDLAQN